MSMGVRGQPMGSALSTYQAGSRDQIQVSTEPPHWSQPFCQVTSIKCLRNSESKKYTCAPQPVSGDPKSASRDRAGF